MMRSLLNSPVGSRIPPFLLATACLLLVCGSAFSQTAQVRKGAPAGPATTPEDGSPAFHEYRGVQLGMISDEVRKKLGDPKDKGEEQDFWVFEEETAQIVYDKTHKVITISADFTNTNKAITAKQIFGADLEAKADGSMYKMVRYPKAGYWLSYNRTSGTTPLITVTLQKMP